MTKDTCFIAMPVATRPEHEAIYGDPDHWEHVMEMLFVPAIEDAGMEAIRPIADSSEMIHGRIIENLIKSTMVLCDLSSHNPNVFFELGVRTSLNKPIALVKDERTAVPFDTGGINTLDYASSISSWEIGPAREALTEFLKKTRSSSGGENPLWRHFGVAIRAHEPQTNETPTDARIDLLTSRVEDLSSQLAGRANNASGDDLQAQINKLAKVRVGINNRDAQEAFIREVRSIPNFKKFIPHIAPTDHRDVTVALISPTPHEILAALTESAKKYDVTPRLIKMSRGPESKDA